MMLPGSGHSQALRYLPLMMFMVPGTTRVETSYVPGRVDLEEYRSGSSKHSSTGIVPVSHRTKEATMLLRSAAVAAVAVVADAFAPTCVPQLRRLIDCTPDCVPNFVLSFTQSCAHTDSFLVVAAARLAGVRVSPLSCSAPARRSTGKTGLVAVLTASRRGSRSAAKMTGVAMAPAARLESSEGET